MTSHPIIISGDIIWYLDEDIIQTISPDNDIFDWISLRIHNCNGPAIERMNGDKVWFINGVRHREDGPAIERANGDKEWWINGQRHREDGPAIEWVDGSKAWYYHGQYIECDNQQDFERLMKLLPFL